MKENIVQTKSYAFAIKIVNTCKFLQTEKKEFILSKQLLRSGTSVGANIEEAIGGQSRKDFYAKLTISYKEARETKYWIRLLTDTHYLTKSQSKPLLNDIEEILRIIGSIQKTMRNTK
ncbi:four helix bundle protein [Algibacter pacificus]|uniref:four helix bundle protein n=1 Tax=Algibacter pacificus TaxID=2599389 RepID=UPI0011CA94A9|nr:four helix bundle protein [Algibacter pacificus]